MDSCTSNRWRHGCGRRGFSLAELLVVVGVIALLIAVILAPLRMAHRQAKQTQCAANLHQLGVALGTTREIYDFYPLWDDQGGPVRYTWIDVLVQTGALSSSQVGYCGEDARPDPINQARGTFFGLFYPGRAPVRGIDYSYGIGVPLSAGGWAWRRGFGEPNDGGSRFFEEHDSYPANRLLAADATWSTVYNLSGNVLTTNIWNQPTQFDNMIAWRRHPGLSANLLLQDGHVQRSRYQAAAEIPADTVRYFLWYRGEPHNVGPDYYYNGNSYPNVPPVNLDNPFDPGAFPLELVPEFYTRNNLWTEIENK